MTRAELAAEMLRIHDLIAAEPGPQTEEEWQDVSVSLQHADLEVAALQRQIREQSQPRMVDGIGLCTVHCSHYYPLDGTSREHSVTGQCLKVTMGTRSMVPCRPWVDALKLDKTNTEWSAQTLKSRFHDILARAEHAEAMNRKLQERIRVMLPDLQHEQPGDALPCEQMIDIHHTCGDPTVARDAFGKPRCRPHGGRSPGEARR